MWYLVDIHHITGSVCIEYIENFSLSKHIHFEFESDEGEYKSFNMYNVWNNEAFMYRKKYGDINGILEYFKQVLGEFTGFLDGHFYRMPKKYKRLYDKIEPKCTNRVIYHNSLEARYASDYYAFITLSSGHTDLSLWDLLLEFPEYYEINGNTLKVLVNNTVGEAWVSTELYYTVPSNFKTLITKLRILEV
jgi:hypothetical protein